MKRFCLVMELISLAAAIYAFSRQQFSMGFALFATSVAYAARGETYQAGK
jgi:hypothetical protein